MMLKRSQQNLIEQYEQIADSLLDVAELIVEAKAANRCTVKYLRDYNGDYTDPYRTNQNTGGLNAFVKDYVYGKLKLAINLHAIPIYAMDIFTLRQIGEIMGSVPANGIPPLSTQTTGASPAVVFAPQTDIKYYLGSAVNWPGTWTPMPTVFVVTFEHVIDPNSPNYDEGLDKLTGEAVLAHEFAHVAQRYMRKFKVVEDYTTGKQRDKSFEVAIYRPKGEAHDPMTGQSTQLYDVNMAENHADEVMFAHFLRDHEGVPWEDSGMVIRALQLSGLLRGGYFEEKMNDYRTAIYAAYGKGHLKTLVDPHYRPTGLAMGDAAAARYVDAANFAARELGLPDAFALGLDFHVNGKADYPWATWLLPSKPPSMLTGEDRQMLAAVAGGQIRPEDSGGLIQSYGGEYPQIGLYMEPTRHLQWAVSTAVNKLGLSRVAGLWIADLTQSVPVETDIGDNVTDTSGGASLLDMR